MFSRFLIAVPSIHPNRRHRRPDVHHQRVGSMQPQAGVPGWCSWLLSQAGTPGWRARPTRQVGAHSSWRSALGPLTPKQPGKYDEGAALIVFHPSCCSWTIIPPAICLAFFCCSCLRLRVLFFVVFGRPSALFFCFCERRFARRSPSPVRSAGRSVAKV